MQASLLWLLDFYIRNRFIVDVHSPSLFKIWDGQVICYCLLLFSRQRPELFIDLWTNMGLRVHLMDKRGRPRANEPVVIPRRRRSSSVPPPCRAVFDDTPLQPNWDKLQQVLDYSHSLAKVS